jgi:CheY-like chemotaxis protein
VTEPSGESVRVLICDDEQRLAELTAGLLRHFGFEADAVVDGERALEVVGSGSRVDVLILDVNLPGLSAEEVVRRLREDGGSTRVVLTSGLSEEDVPASLSADPSVVGYLAKPYPVERLVATVRDALSA